MSTKKPRSKPKPKMLSRVYWKPDEVTRLHYPDYDDKSTRFTVRKEPLLKDYAIWDKEADGWLFPETRRVACKGNIIWPHRTSAPFGGHMRNWIFPAKTYQTRAEAWHYLETTSEGDEEYKLALINRKLRM
jgi:hypothetical protein